MEELYRKLFQCEESVERERELDALFRSLDFFVMRCTNKDLKKECGRLKMHDSSTGVGCFDFQTRLRQQ